MIKNRLFIGQWPVRTKPIYPACRYVRLWGVFTLLCMPTSNNVKALYISFGEEMTKFLKMLKYKTSILIQKKTTMQQIYEEIYYSYCIDGHVSLLLIRDTWTFDFDVISDLCLYRNDNVPWIKTYFKVISHLSYHLNL